MVTEEGQATQGTSTIAPEDAKSSEQMIPFARVQEMRKEWEADFQRKFNPDLDHKRNEALKRAEAADKEKREAQDALVEAEEKADAYETAKDPESLRRALATVRRRQAELDTLTSRHTAQMESERATLEQDKAELRLQQKWGVDAEWIAAHKAKGMTLSDMLFEAAALKTPATLKTKVEGAGPPFEQMGGGGEQVTKDNVDKLHLEGKYPDDKYRTFLRTGQL